MSLHLLETFKAVFWSFFGVRKRAHYESDARKLNPVHVVVVGVICTIGFVLALYAFVNFITR